MEGKLVPRINSISLGLVDDHVRKPATPMKITIDGVENIFFISAAINTHRGWVYLDLEPSKEFYKLLARGFKPTSHAKIKLDRKNRRVAFHLSLEKEVEICRPGNIKPIDVNENSMATLYEAFAAILETDLAKTTLGIAIGRKASRGEMDPIAERLGRLWRSLERGRRGTIG
jgi:hypothetical protein